MIQSITMPEGRLGHEKIQEAYAIEDQAKQANCSVTKEKNQACQIT
ncbi:MAG: hypothetical protein U5K51_14260 [Flavobacteriaceae bacterium]|nr:hypothetical protein [Flavobacteriaceae bacterium]